MVYKLVTDRLLKELKNEVECVRCHPTASSYVPTSSSDTNGCVGQISYDANFLYIKITATTWKRVTLSSF